MPYYRFGCWAYYQFFFQFRLRVYYYAFAIHSMLVAIQERFSRARATAVRISAGFNPSLNATWCLPNHRHIVECRRSVSLDVIVGLLFLFLKAEWSLEFHRSVPFSFFERNRAARWWKVRQPQLSFQQMSKCYLAKNWNRNNQTCRYPSQIERSRRLNNWNLLN